MKNLLLTKTSALLKAVAASPEPVSLKILKKSLEIPTPTLSRICGDLTEMGLLYKVDYYRYTLGETVISWAEVAKRQHIISSAAEKWLLPFARLWRFNVMVYSFRKGRFFSIYEFSERYGSENALWRTGAYLLLTAMNHFTFEEAKKYVESIKPDITESEMITLDGEYHRVQTQKRLVRQIGGGEDERFLAINFPLSFRKESYCVSFYGNSSVRNQLEKVVFEAEMACSKLAANLHNFEMDQE